MHLERSLLITLLLLASTALAGCHEAPPPDRDDDLGDEGDGGGGTQQGDQLPNGTGGENDTDTGIAPQEDEREDRQDGLRLVARLEPCEAGHCINATVTNDGDRTYHISDICVGPFRETMTHDGEQVQPREPTVHCEAFGTRAFEPGDKTYDESTWDEQVWNDETEQVEPAEAGTYEWTIMFRAYHDAEGGEHTDLEVTFSIQVGAQT